MLLLADLLIEALASGAARIQGIAAAVDGRRLGPYLSQELSAYLRSLGPAELGRRPDGRDDVHRIAVVAVDSGRDLPGPPDAPRRRPSSHRCRI